MPTSESTSTPLDDYSASILSRCRSAVRNHGGHPNPAWSHGEQMIVALVLDDGAFLTEVGTTMDVARQRLLGDLCWNSGRAWSADDLTTWITDIRNTVLAGE